MQRLVVRETFKPFVQHTVSTCADRRIVCRVIRLDDFGIAVEWKPKDFGLENVMGKLATFDNALRLAGLSGSYGCDVDSRIYVNDFSIPTRLVVATFVDVSRHLADYIASTRRSPIIADELTGILSVLYNH